MNTHKEKSEHNEIKKKAQSILRNISCEFAEIRLSSSASTTIVLSGADIDAMSAGSTIAGSARILNNGAWGFVSFNNLDDIETFIKKADAISKQLSPLQKTELYPYEAIKKDFSTTFEIDFRGISIDEKFNLTKSYNNILKDSQYIETTRATYRDLHSDYTYINSNGSDIHYDKLFCGISLSSIAKDGAIIQPYHEANAGYGGYEIVQNMEEKASFVAKISVDLLKAESVEGGKYKIIADPKLAGVFVHEAFGHLSEADFIHENDQMKKIMILGKEFGPKELQIIDDGTMKGLTGYIPFDDEGVLPQKTYLIKNGILNERLHSRETAQKMDEKTTGNGRAISVMTQPIVRMTNTYIDNGPYTKEELFDSIEDGLYAIDTIGGQTNLEMFTFTSSYGYEIKNGKPGKMYKDIVLSGNTFTTLKNITMIANDKTMYGGLGGCGKGGQSPLPVAFGGPHMLIEDVLIGGSQ